MLTVDEMLKELKAGKIIRMRHPEFDSVEFMSITQNNPFNVPRKDPAVYSFNMDYYSYEGEEPQMKDMHVNHTHVIAFDELFLCEFTVVTLEEMFREIKEKCKKQSQLDKPRCVSE